MNLNLPDEFFQDVSINQHDMQAYLFNANLDNDFHSDFFNEL